jgi:glycerol-3-phosphate acyltransferase PlsX
MKSWKKNSLDQMIIAIDTMGGDFGPKVTVPASLQILKKYPKLRLILVGDESSVHHELNRLPHDGVLNRLEIIHTTQQVAMDELPSTALRSKKDSSMRVALNKIKEGKAQACVSAGNTGALMATARFVLKTLPGVDRPAIITSLPTVHPNKEVRMLDLGANVDSSAEHLFQFAVMGSVLVSALDNIKQPKVALLNIGEEEMKGNEQVKETAQLLSDSSAVNYIGYIEGNAIFSGIADVVVCDGFVGNIALKTLEGTASLFANYMKKAFNRNWLTRLTALIARPSLYYVKAAMDPGSRNGASLIGLQGIVIKSHGSAKTAAFAVAIEEAVHEVEKNIPQLIRQEVEIRVSTQHLKGALGT